MSDQNNEYIAKGKTIEWLRSDEYWHGLLLDYEDVIGIEGVKRSVDFHETERQIVTISLQNDIIQHIDCLSKEMRVTPQSIFEAAWGRLLQRYNDVDDVVFGELDPCSQENENSNICIYPVRVTVAEKLLVNELIRKINRQDDENKNHKLLVINHDDLAVGLFETLLVYQENVNESVEDFCKRYQNLPYSCILVITRHENQLDLSVIFNSLCFQEDVMKYILEVLNNILIDITSYPEKEVLKVQGLSSEMKQDMIAKFNHKTEDIKYETIIEVFQQHKASNPDKIALIMENETMTYQELDIASDQVACYIQKQGIHKGDFVALYTERSFQMVIAMLAVLKAGAAFVPIHLEFSKEHIEYILNDCNAKLLISYIENKSKNELHVTIPVLDFTNRDIFQGNESVNQTIVRSDVAFATYTSGTTGKPKGIIGTHLSLLSSVLSDIWIFGLTASDVILQYSNYTYMQSMLDIYSSLVVGCSLCLISNDTVYDFAMIEKCINDHCVTKVSLTPTFINGLNPEHCRKLRILDSTGEPFDVEVLNRWVGSHEVYNSYGTTEVVANSSSYHYTREDLINVPIGKPSLYSNYSILDQHGNLCGVGMIGELYIGGITLTKGYSNNPELNRKQFVTNPYTGERAYRTGDLARWRMDGNVECLKRIDDQIKISGKRIELEEIRGAIRKFDKIKNCVVFAKKDHTGSKKLFTYYTADEPISKNMVRNHLLKYIPEYMVPVYIGQVNQIPMNKNGKVDKKSLPDLEQIKESNYVSPVTEEEIILQRIFNKVFHREQIGVEDNFYDLGGDSISAIHITSQLLDYNYQVTAMDVMKYLSIRKIAQYMTKCGQYESKDKESSNTDTEVSDLDLSIINGLFQ